MLGFVGLVLGAVGGTWLTTRPVDNASSIRFPVDLPDGLRLLWPFTPVALSPDGRTLAFVGTDVAGPPRIFVRPLGQMIARELSGTRNAEQIFFSPDGRWIGFYTGLALRKVSIEGGAPLFIADVPQMAGASWTRDDEIVVSSQGRLALLSANGGPLRPIIAPDSAGWRAILPHVLEDGTTIVYTARPKMLEDSRIAVASLRGGASRVLDLPGTTPLGVIDGHLLYLTSHNLTYARNSISAVPFDVRRRVTTGPPAPLIDSVAMNAAGHVSASLSSSGSLVYVFRGDYRSRLVLRGMDGSQRVVTPEARYYLNPRFSPDGRRIAVDIESDTSTQRFVHILDPASGALTQLSTRPGVGPEWTADGTRILFSSRGELWIRKADLSTPEELLLGGKDLQHASGPIPAYDGALSRDERILVARVQLPDGNRKLLYRIVGDTSLRPVGFTPVDEFAPRISPDGRWVAYQSAPDVFISPLPGPGPRHQIIVDGRGGMPLWSHDGRRLYYTEDRRLMSVTLAWSPSFAILSRDTVLTDRLDERVLFHANWDVSPDERSFLLNQMVAGPRLIFVHDWRQELRERVSGGGGGR